MERIFKIWSIDSVWIRIFGRERNVDMLLPEEGAPTDHRFEEGLHLMLPSVCIFPSLSTGIIFLLIRYLIWYFTHTINLCLFGGPYSTDWLAFSNFLVIINASLFHKIACNEWISVNISNVWNCFYSLVIILCNRK